jgi:hypothetical protein
MWGFGLDSLGSGYSPMEWFYDNGDKSLGFIKVGNFFIS